MQNFYLCIFYFVYFFWSGPAQLKAQPARPLAQASGLAELIKVHA